MRDSRETVSLRHSTGSRNSCQVSVSIHLHMYRESERMPKRLSPPVNRYRSIPTIPRHQLPLMLEWLSNGYGGLTAETLARRYGWQDPNSVRRFIKRETGKTIKQHMELARVRKARRLLLRFPNRTMERIARGVGWKSRSHFSRVFKKWTGLGPAEYRETRLRARQES